MSASEIVQPAQEYALGTDVKLQLFHPLTGQRHIMDARVVERGQGQTYLCHLHASELAKTVFRAQILVNVYDINHTPPPGPDFFGFAKEAPAHVPLPPA